MMMSINDCVTV